MMVNEVNLALILGLQIFYLLVLTFLILLFKGCVCYIFASLFFKSKQEHLLNQEKCFLFHFKTCFRS